MRCIMQDRAMCGRRYACRSVACNLRGPRHRATRWTMLEGNSSGQTQVDVNSNSEMSVWAAPIDVRLHLMCSPETCACAVTLRDNPQIGCAMLIWQVHYSTTTIHGWPKFSCEVWSQDEHGRNILAGYGFCHGMLPYPLSSWWLRPRSALPFSCLLV